MDKEFDSKLQERLDAYRPELTPQIWDRIQTELDQKQETVVLGVQEARRFQWSKWAAAAVFLIAIGAIYFATNQPQDVIYLSAHAPEQTAEGSPEIRKNTSGPATNTNQSAESGGKKLSDDIQTISRFLAATLQATERNERNERNEIDAREARDEDKIMDQKLSQLAINNTEHIQTTLPESFQNPVTANVDEMAVLNENTLASVQIDPDLSVSAGGNLHAPQVEKLNPEIAGGHIGDETQVRSRFGVSKLLNLMVAQIDKRDKKFVSFSNDDEGSLKVDFNLAQARN